jgi:hypothetical protein
MLVVTDSGERFDLLAHARAAGARNLPATSATVPNEVEQAAIHQAQEDHLDAARRARDARDHAVAEFDALERSLPERRDLDRVVERAQERVEAELGSDRSVKERCEDLHRAHLALRRLIRELGLAREPRYPASRLLHYGLIAALFVLEAVVNAGFFARLSPDGLSGGVLLAAGVALVNVGLGLLAGDVLLRHLHHPRHHRLAQVGLILYGTATIACNLVVAHMRDIALTASSASSEFPVLSFESWLLFALGVISSLMAARAAYLADDPAPGFGRAHRRFVQAQREFRSAQEGLHARLLAYVQAIPDGCAAVLTRMRDGLGHLVKIRLRVNEVIEVYDGDRVRCETTCTHVLRVYRGENRAVRTSPAPQYFEDYPFLETCLPDRQLLTDMDLRIRAGARRAEVLAQEAGSVEAGGCGRIEAVNQRFRDFVASIESKIEIANEAVGTFEFGPFLPAR